MLAKIIGAFWTIFGLIWIIKPLSLKARLQKKLNRRIKLIVYIFLLIFGVIIIASVIKAHGWAAKVAGLAGIAITIYAIRLLTSRASGKIIEWLSKRGAYFFRILALVIFCIGIMLVLA